jgi:hypothetical protein
MLNRILHRAFLKFRCGKQHCFLRAKRHQFGIQRLYVLALDSVFVVLAFHKNEKIRSENSKSCCYIDFIGTIVPVDTLPVFRLKFLEFTGGRLQVLLNLQFKLD